MANKIWKLIRELLKTARVPEKRQEGRNGIYQAAVEAMKTDVIIFMFEAEVASPDLVDLLCWLV